MQTQLREASQRPRVIFLHGGPGFSAELGRRRYANRLPVHWWDQPRIAVDAAKPFEALVSAAREQLMQLSERQGAPVAVLASSFGAFLACELLATVPERIESVTFSAGMLDVRLPFVRWGRRLGRRLANPELEAASHAAEVSTEPETFWTLIGQIVAVPNFFDDYWGPDSTQQRTAMRALAAEGPMFDLPTFQAVINELLSYDAPALATHLRAAGRGTRVRVLMGRHDPQADEADALTWQKLLPSALIERVDCGHFPHLELPPEVWMPARAR